MERMDNLEAEINNMTHSDSTDVNSSSDDNGDDDSPSIEIGAQSSVAVTMHWKRKIDNDTETGDSEGKGKV